MKPKSSICHRCHRLCAANRARYCERCERELRAGERRRNEEKPGTARLPEKQDETVGLQVGSGDDGITEKGGAREVAGKAAE